MKSLAHRWTIFWVTFSTEVFLYV